jgi:hypothetical protein
MRAYHAFIQAGVVAQGLLQYLAVAAPKLVWSSFGSRLRTIRPGIPPSEFVVAKALRQTLPEFLMGVPQKAIPSRIHRRAAGHAKHPNFPLGFQRKKTDNPQNDLPGRTLELEAQALKLDRTFRLSKEYNKHEGDGCRCRQAYDRRPVISHNLYRVGKAGSGDEEPVQVHGNDRNGADDRKPKCHPSRQLISCRYLRGFFHPAPPSRISM